MRDLLTSANSNTLTVTIQPATVSIAWSDGPEYTAAPARGAGWDALEPLPVPAGAGWDVLVSQ